MEAVVLRTNYLFRSTKGLTLVAMKLYFNKRGVVKVDLALAKGKRTVDKRRVMAERDAKRDVERAMKYRR